MAAGASVNGRPENERFLHYTQCRSNGQHMVRSRHSSMSLIAVINVPSESDVPLAIFFGAIS
jgi:hypothetical protein